MKTCKQPKPQSTPPAPLIKGGGSISPAPLGKGGGSISPASFGKGGGRISKTFIDRGTLTPSPRRRGLGRGYLYLLQKSIPAKDGFTIVECLLAIILVGILMTAIAPVIVLSVATRVQARRVEQATLAARTYIDAVQTGTAPMPANTVPLYEAGATTVGATTKTYLGSDRASFATVVAPPSTLPSCLDDGTQITLDDGTQIKKYPYCTYTPGVPALPSLYCIDNDGGGCSSGSPRDYIVQAFRSVNATAPGVRPVDANGKSTDTGTGGYVLGVRVYRADAFDGTATLQTTSVNNGKKVATTAGGKGNQFAPIVEMTTEVRPQSDSNSPGSALKSLKERFGSAPTPAPS